MQMYLERQCAICKKPFQPRQYNHTMCSDECRQKQRNNYAAKLSKSGYFTDWQRDNKDSINANKVARYSDKIGKKDGKLPARTCPECGVSFVPKNTNKRFCTHKCNVKYMKVHPEEKRTRKKRKPENQ